MKRILVLSILLFAPSLITAMEVTRSQSQEQESSQGRSLSALNSDGTKKAIYNLDDKTIKIVDASTGAVVSNLGQVDYGEQVSSIRFRGDNIIMFINPNGKMIDDIFLREDYTYRSKESLFNPREVNLSKYGVV